MVLDADFIVPQITIAIEFGVHDEGVSSTLCLLSASRLRFIEGPTVCCQLSQTTRKQDWPLWHVIGLFRVSEKYSQTVKKLTGQFCFLVVSHREGSVVGPSKMLAS